MNAKYLAMTGRISRLKGAVVAFSGGVDSSLLLAAAVEALGGRVLAVTARSALRPAFEGALAQSVASSLGAELRFLDTGEMGLPAFTANGPDRCYHCKKGLMLALRAIADERGFEAVLEGSNADDATESRPGAQAVMECGALSPLEEAGLAKAEIRALARARGLACFDRPSSPCLATRIPERTVITLEKLRRIEAAEGALRELGFADLRVRDHGDLARIEVHQQDLGRFADPELRRLAALGVRKAGFRFVALDLDGYRNSGEPIG